MMGRQPNLQQKLFYDRIRLDHRIRLDEAAPRSYMKTQPVSWLRKNALGNSPLSRNA
jgi:hypothetical protein